MLIPVPGAWRRCLPILLCVVVGLLGETLRAQSALDGFDPEVTGSVNALAVYSLKAGAYAGKIVVGGSFSQIQPHLLVTYYPASGLARLNLDGTVDTSFAIPTLTYPGNASLPAQVNKLIAMDNGQVIVGGNFQVTAGGQTLKYLVRFNADGSVDTTFTPSLVGDVNGAVTGLYTQATDYSAPIYVGGNFNQVTWNGASIGSVNSMGHAFRLNTGGAGNPALTLDTVWQPNADAQVDAFGVQPDGNIVIGGAFLNVQGVPRTYLARVNTTDAAVDNSYNPQPNAQVTSLVIETTGNAVIGGWFTQLNPLQTNGTYLAASSTVGYIARILLNGEQDTSFVAAAANDVQGLLLEDNGDIVLVGDLGLVAGSVSASQGDFIARLLPTGQPDGTFLPGFDATTYAVAEMPNGQLIVGGIFNSVNTGHSADAIPRKALARLNADGTLDSDFNPSAFGGFGTIYVESDGSYLVGGSFTSIGNVTIRNLAHILPNGSVDTGFEPDPDGPVQAITIDANGMIVIGGFFQNPVPVGESTAIPYLARMSKTGVLDTTFQPDPNFNVDAIIATGTGSGVQYIVGGGFTIWNQGQGATVSTSTTTVLAEYLARVNNDGSIDQTFEPTPTPSGAEAVSALLIDSTGKYVIVGGSFSGFTPAGTLVKAAVTSNESDVARINLTDGTVDTTWNPNSLASIVTSGPVNALALEPNGEILIGGTFSGLVPGNAPLDPVSHLPIPTYQAYLALIQTNGDIDTSFTPSIDGPIYAEAIDPVTGKIYIGGVFKNVDNEYQPYLARLNANGTIDKNTSTVTGFGDTLNGPATAIAPLGGTADQVLVGGAFTQVTPFGSTTVLQEGHLVRFNPDGSVDTSFSVSANVSGSVNTIALADNGLIYIGGSFSNIGGAYASDLARFWNDSSYDPTFGADPRGGTGAGVNTVVVESNGNSVYVGGSFSGIGTNNAVGNFARINNDGSIDPTFAPPLINGTVNAANPEPSGEMVVGGNFTSITNATGTQYPLQSLALLYTIGNNAGNVDPGFNAQLNAGAVVNSVVVQPDTRILIGGSFTSINGTAVSNLARLNADGSLDSSFNPMVTGGPVNAIALEPDGSVVIGGSFTAVGGTAQANLAIVSSSGALSPAFGIAVNGPVRAVVLENPDNGAPDSILVGGTFSLVGGQARNNLARLIYPTGGAAETAENTAPTVDPAYNPNVNGTVNTVAFDPNGKTYIGGAFTMVGSIARNGVARLTETGLAVSQIEADPTYTKFTWTLAGEVPEMNSVIFQSSPDGFTWTTLGAGTQGAGNTWTINGANTEAVPTGGSFFIQAIGESQTTEYASESEFQQVFHFYGVPQASLQSESSVGATVGVPFYYELGVTNESGFSATATNIPPGLSFNGALAILYGTPTQAGTYTLEVTLTNENNGVPDSVTVPLTITVLSTAPAGAPVAPFARLYNLSSLGYVSSLSVMSAGFIIGGNGPLNVLLRAIGPGLAAFGLSAGQVPLSQPHATLFDSHQQPIIVAEGWDNSEAMMQLTAMVGAFPIQPGTDTSFATVLAPGSYTMQITTGDGTAGETLAEVYDAETNPLDVSQRLINISSIAQVSPGAPLLGGFVIGGTVPKTLIIRGVGPGLAGLGITNNLFDPVLTLYTASGTEITTNSDWMVPPTSSLYPIDDESSTSYTQFAADMAAVGAFALPTTGYDFNDTAGTAEVGYDTAIEITLPPGSYTAEITSASGETGTAMVEVYEFGE